MWDHVKTFGGVWGRGIKGSDLIHVFRTLCGCMWRIFRKAGEATRKPVWTLLQVTRWGTWASRQQQDKEVEGRAGGGDEGRPTAWTRGCGSCSSWWVSGAVSTLGRRRRELGKEITSVPGQSQILTLLPSTPTASSTPEYLQRNSGES